MAKHTYPAKKRMLRIMNNRIKILRKSLDMSQDEFGQMLGVQKTTISKIERGEISVTEQALRLICSTTWPDGHRVSESWLRDGVGDMFVTNNADDEIMEYVSRLEGPNADLQKRLLLLMARLNEDQWNIVVQTMRDLLASQEISNNKEAPIHLDARINTC